MSDNSYVLEADDPAEQARLRRERVAAQVKAAAEAAWAEMSDNDKAIVRIGMIPAWAAEKHAPTVDDDGRKVPSHLFACALMDLTKGIGGMIA